MRGLAIVLAIGCGGSQPLIPPVAPPPPPAPPPPAPVVEVAPPEPMDVETVEGPTSSPGRHPRIPHVPSARDLDAAAIRRTVRRAMPQIAACYEQLAPAELPRVIARFTIGPTGAVLSSQASGAQGELDNCIARAFAGLTFEKPADGGTITVSYPLQFRRG